MRWILKYKKSSVRSERADTQRGTRSSTPLIDSQSSLQKKPLKMYNTFKKIIFISKSHDFTRDNLQEITFQSHDFRPLVEKYVV